MPSSALPPSEEANGRSRVLTGSGLPASRPAPGSDLSPIPTARWGQAPPAASQTRPYSLRPQIRPAGAAWLPIEPDPGPARGSSARREAKRGAAAPRNDAGCRVPPRAERASGGAQGGRAASVGAEGQLRGVAYHLNDACEAAARRAAAWGAPCSMAGVLHLCCARARGDSTAGQAVLSGPRSHATACMQGLCTVWRVRACMVQLGPRRMCACSGCELLRTGAPHCWAAGAGRQRLFHPRSGSRSCACGRMLRARASQSVLLVTGSPAERALASCMGCARARREAALGRLARVAVPWCRPAAAGVSAGRAAANVNAARAAIVAPLQSMCTKLSLSPGCGAGAASEAPQAKRPATQAELARLRTVRSPRFSRARAHCSPPGTSGAEPRRVPARRQTPVTRSAPRRPGPPAQRRSGGRPRRWRRAGQRQRDRAPAAPRPCSATCSRRC